MKHVLTLNPTFRPPVVTVLGHVDHGKTTLLDKIRKTNLAAQESGGITQHIGAYQIEIPQKVKKQETKTITFIDTPGHEAFSQMRKRGAKVADIAILVVAGNDGVMPQTIESINLIKATKIPCVVAITKIDLPDINLEKIKKQLINLGLDLEEYGGETPVVPLSAKTGEGIEKLLEMILLLAELHQIKDNSNEKFKGVVIESSLTKNRGPVATVIVQSGYLGIFEEIVCEDQEFRVRAILNWLGKPQEKITSGNAAEILGWKKLPSVGSILYKKQEITIEKSPKKEIEKPKSSPLTTYSLENPLDSRKLKIILKADTTGTLEAILASLPQEVIVLYSQVGNINESDILFAKTAKAIVIGFGINPSSEVLKLASTEKVIIKAYNIIYELITEIKEVAETLQKGELVEILGKAKILALFKIRDQIIAGVKVISGRIAKGDQVKVLREEKEIGKSRIKSLKHKKEEITKAEQGMEAGVLLQPSLELLTGDSIISIG